MVTAQRRNESIEKVPLTIQAFTGQTLSQLNVTTLDDLLKYTPNVTYGNNGPGQGNIFIRGLSAGFAGEPVQRHGRQLPQRCGLSGRPVVPVPRPATSTSTWST